MRVLLDARVLAAAFATRGLCADVLRTVLVHHELMVTHAVLRELRQLLTQRLGVPPATADQIVPFLREHTRTGGAPSPNAGVEVDVAVTITSTRAQDLSAAQTTDPRGFWRLLTHPEH